MKLTRPNHIEISRRNARTLLWALDQNLPHPVLTMTSAEGVTFSVRIAEDIDHYEGRDPGPMPFDDEEN